MYSFGELGKKLADPGGFSDADRQNAGRHRIQRSEMSDFRVSNFFAHRLHDVVRGHACGFIDDENSVHGPWIVDYHPAFAHGVGNDPYVLFRFI